MPAYVERQFADGSIEPIRALSPRQSIDIYALTGEGELSQLYHVTCLGRITATAVFDIPVDLIPDRRLPPDREAKRELLKSLAVAKHIAALLPLGATEHFPINDNELGPHLIRVEYALAHRN